MELCHNDLLRSKIFQILKSSVKILASLFWEKDGVFLRKYILWDRTINEEYYMSLLNELREDLKQTCRGKLSHDVPVLQDNA